MEIDREKTYLLKGKVQHYDWGGTEFIPKLLGIANPEKKPFAEYWMGAHAEDSSSLQLDGAQFISLNKLIDHNPEAYLGKYVLARFSRFPYLLKVLDVKEMLSIQVHPEKKAAEKEFIRENIEGIALNASNRNYKDDNHKPELMVALGDFWLLHGFKNAEGITEILRSYPEFNSLIDIFESEGYDGLCRTVLQLEQGEVTQILQPLIQRINVPSNSGVHDRKSPDYWTARATEIYGTEKIDRGIFFIYFFNLVHLKKGEGIFQAAGIPHAYLEGQNIEIMSNSDNVLRAGLTSKHIDVKEVMKHIKCEAVRPAITAPPDNPANEIIYPAPAPDFQLSCFMLGLRTVVSFTSITAEIIFVLKGEVKISTRTGSLILRKGMAAIVFAGQTVVLEGLIKSEIYKASVPFNFDF